MNATTSRPLHLLLSAALLAAAGCSSSEPSAEAEARPTSRQSEDASAQPAASQPAASQPASRPTKPAAPALALSVEEAHGGLERWKASQGVHSDLVVVFGGKERFRGTMRFVPDLARARLEVKGGPVVVFDGSTCWLDPADSTFAKPRFHVLTWSYFLAAPFKLRDPGSSLAPLADQALAEGTQPGPSARLTFAAGTGDAPDDWYVVYQDPASKRLAGLAYVVTYGGPSGELEPHAVRYHDYQTIEGVAVPLRWTFHLWSKEKGIFGEPIGEVTLSNTRFGPISAESLSKPSAAAREVRLPGAK